MKVKQEVCVKYLSSMRRFVSGYLLVCNDEQRWSFRLQQMQTCEIVRPVTHKITAFLRQSKRDSINAS